MTLKTKFQINFQENQAITKAHFGYVETKVLSWKITFLAKSRNKCDQFLVKDGYFPEMHFPFQASKQISQEMNNNGKKLISKNRIFLQISFTSGGKKRRTRCSSSRN